LKKYFFIVLLFVTVDLYGTQSSGDLHKWDWKKDTEVPFQDSRNGLYYGIIDGKVIVAGGCLEASEGVDKSRKMFDEIFIQDTGLEGELRWKKSSVKLPEPIAFGASVDTPFGLILAGGKNLSGYSNKVYLIRMKANDIELSKLQCLPAPCAYNSGLYSDGFLYIAGGRNKQESLKSFCRLNMIKTKHGSDSLWEILEPWPGSARYSMVIQPQSDGFQDYLFLFGGSDEEKHFRDCFKYNPSGKDRKWQTISSMPQAFKDAAVAQMGQSHILLLANVEDSPEKIQDDRKANMLPVKMLTYHTVTDTWAEIGEISYNIFPGKIYRSDNKINVLGVEKKQEYPKTILLSAQIPEPKNAFKWLDYVMLIAYLLLLIMIGFYFSKREENTHDYFLGGNRIPWWAAGLSIMATQVSSIGFMAIPAKTYATNWLYFPGILTWFIVVPIVNAFFIPFFRKLNVTSAYEYLEARFNLPVRLSISCIFILFQLVRMSVVLYLPALALSAVTGLGTYQCIIIMGILATVYTVAGGIEAVIWTDVVQAGLLIGGATFCVLLVMFSIQGGPKEFFAVACSGGKFDMVQLGWSPYLPVLWVILVGNVFNRITGLVSDQTIVQRYMTTPDIKQAKRALWMDVVVSIPWAIIVFMFGTALFVFYKKNPADLSPFVNTDGIVPLFITQQLPMGISGIIIAAIFAAAMSSLDSSMHSTSTVIITDFYERFKKVKGGNHLLLARVLTALLGGFAILAAIYLATSNIKSLWDFFIKTLGMFTGPMAGVFMLGIFSKRANGLGALIGLIVGTLSLWVVQEHTRINFFLYAMIGTLVCWLVGYLVSIIFPFYGKNTEGLNVHQT